MVVPGYLLPTPTFPILLTLGVALLFYIAAFLFNRLRHELRVAVYMLIGGGVLATTAQVFVTAILSSSSAHTAQSALLFLPIILEAGLFLTPELTLLVASAAAIVTASAILLALALTVDSANLLSQAYLVMVYTLGLEAFIGYLAWRLAQFIYETVKSAQADDDLQFAQARLSAAQRQMTEQRRQLVQDVATIQMAVSSVLAHEYDTRIEPPEGDLAPLAESLNLVIQQLRSTNDLERKLRQAETQIGPLVEMADRLATGTPLAMGTDTPTDGSLYAVRAALSQAHATLTRRQTRLQEVAAQVGESVRHMRQGLSTTTSESAQAQLVAGKLVSLVGALHDTARRQMELLAQARRTLADALPPELTAGAAGEGALLDPGRRDGQASDDLAGLSADLGIMNHYTNEFPVLSPADQDSINIVRLTRQLPAVRDAHADGEDGAATDDAVGGALSQGALTAGLADTWLLLAQLHTQTVAEARAVTDFVLDIGILSKHVRHTGVNLDRINQSIEMIEYGANQMQQLASLSGTDFDALTDTSVSGMARPGSLSVPRRPPAHSRPLDADARFSANIAGQPPSDDQGMAPPGSLRLFDLIGSDSLSVTDRPATPSNDEQPDSDGASGPEDLQTP
jgi:hypothetical protein